MTFAPSVPQDTPADLEISHAFVRKPGGNLGETGDGVGIPDLDRALYQHEAYCRALSQCGVEVRAAKYDPQFPDGCFISDMAVLAGNLAVIANFPAQSARQGEQQLAASLLAGSRILKFITAPGTLDAADVARVGDAFFIGLSSRTNHEGAAQLAFFLTEFGYQVQILDLPQGGAEKLAAAVCDLGGGRILLREDLSRHFAFLGYEKTVVAWQDRAACTAVRINGHVLMPQGCTPVAETLRRQGHEVIEVQVSEFEKMGGSLSRLSLRLPARRQENVINLSESRARRVA